MIKELKPHVAAYVQQLVGGNSNLESKLQALLTGVFSDTGAIGKTNRRLHDLAVAADEKQGGTVLLIKTLGSDGLRYWSYSNGALKPDDDFSHYSRLANQDEFDAWLVFLRHLPEIAKIDARELEDHWIGDESWDLNFFDSRVYGTGEVGDSIYRCAVYRRVKKPGYASDSLELVDIFSVPDWLRDHLLNTEARRVAVESGAAD